MQKNAQTGREKRWCKARRLCRSCLPNAVIALPQIRPLLGYARSALGLCVVWAFQPDAADQQQMNPASGPHGQLVTLDLTLPDFPSKTHMQQASDFADKLVIGFGLRPEIALEFSDWILEASARQELRPELIASLVLAESSFRKAVRSHVGAIGPTQIRPHYWADFCGHNDLYDPEQNVYCGTQILGFLLERCKGDQACALSAYNVGMNSKRRAAGLRYVAKIDRHLERLSTVTF